MGRPGEAYLRSVAADIAGCVWDTRAQVLYFVDIDGSKVYAYDPVADAVGEESFSSKITALALLESGRGVRRSRPG